MPDDRTPTLRIRSPDQMTTGETKCQRAGLDSHYRLDSHCSTREYRQMCMKSNRLGTQLIRSETKTVSIRKKSRWNKKVTPLPPKFGSKIAQLKVLYQNRTKNPKLGILYPKRTDDTFDKQPWRRDMSMMVFSLRIGFDQKHTITSIYLTCCRTIMVFSAQHGHMKMHGQVGACFLGKKFKNWLISRATGGPKARSKLTFE